MRIVTTILLILAMAVALVVPVAVGTFMGMSQSEQNDSSGGGSTPNEEIDLTLSESEATIGVGATKLLKANIATESDSYIYQWGSSDKSIATVLRSEGSPLEATVTALKSGTTNITINIIDKTKFQVVKSAACVVTVENTSMVFDQSEVSIFLDTAKTATVKAEAPGGGEITWSSSDESIATVSGGVITAHKAGQVFITAKSGEHEGSILVKVYNTRLSIDEVKTVKLGKTVTLSIGDEHSVGAKWTIDDGSIASVSDKGKVTGLKAGMTTVTVKSGSDDQTASCVIIVIDGTDEAVALESGKKSTAAENPGKWYYLCESNQVTVPDSPQYNNGLISFNITQIGTSGANFFYLRYQPDDVGDVTYRNVVYIYAEKEGVHQLNGSDFVVKAGINKVDIEYISASPTDANPYQIKFKASGEYYVLPVFEELSRLEKIVLDTEFATLNTTDNKKVTIGATVPGKDNATFEWSSSNKNVATVSGGVVTAVGEGSAWITVTSGALTAKVLIVVEGADGITGTTLGSGNKSAAVASPGTWFYLADGKSSVYNKPIMESDGNIHLNISAIDDVNKKYVYLRYQPTELKSYTATITIEFAGEDNAIFEITGGDVTTAVGSTLKNGSNSIEFTFTANSSNPLQIKFKAVGSYVVKVTLS